MNVDEIKELAARYVEYEEMSDIPEEGELFYFLHRELPDNTILKDDEGWMFGGYGKILTYEADLVAKPVGKWIYMNYLSLAVCPPQVAEVKLQPPHIAKGLFQSPDRTIETKIVKVLEGSGVTEENDTNEGGKILQFPGKKK